MDNKTKVINILLSSGFSEYGKTTEETRRLFTINSYPLGESIKIGGRLRFKHKDGSTRATVGKITTCLYMVIEGSVFQPENHPTSEITHKIVEEYLKRSLPQATLASQSVTLPPPDPHLHQ